VTLIALIAELRGNTEAIRAQTAQATFQTSAQSFYYADGNVALRKAEDGGLAALTEDECAHAFALMSAIFNMYNNNYHQYQDGNLDEEIHEAYRRRLGFLISNPMYRDRWSAINGRYTDSFREYVDAVIESPEE